MCKVELSLFFFFFICRILACSCFCLLVLPYYMAYTCKDEYIYNAIVTWCTLIYKIKLSSIASRVGSAYAVMSNERL